MANTGHDFAANWTTVQDGVTLTQGGTVESISDAVSLDVTSCTEIAIKAVYSNHAKATAGLSVYIARDANDAYEDDADGPWGFEMPFTQNDTHRKTITFGPASNIKIHLVWGNTTGSSAVTVTTSYKKADIPAAS